MAMLRCCLTLWVMAALPSVGHSTDKAHCDLEEEEHGLSVHLLQWTATPMSLAHSDAILHRSGVWTMDSCQDESTEVVTPANVTFIHIPRNAGSSIEECTLHKEDNDKWGSLNPFMRSKLDHEWTHCYMQHVPPSLLPEFYGNRETFCVVRDPYERAVSQLGFAAGYFPHLWGCNASSLTNYLSQRLPVLKSEPYTDDCHFLPQAAYTAGWDAVRKEVNRSAQSCDRILRFETLVPDFNREMESLGFGYRLTRTTINANTQSATACHLLGVRDLTEEVRRLIEDVYAVDFDLFGYSVLTPADS